jgi:hypothetical protein
MVDFSTTELVDQSQFKALEQNEEVACTLWHINSGFHGFSWGGFSQLKEFARRGRRRSKEKSY